MPGTYLDNEFSNFADILYAFIVSDNVQFRFSKFLLIDLSYNCNKNLQFRSQVTAVDLYLKGSEKLLVSGTKDGML